MGLCTVCLFTLAITFLTTCTQGQDTSYVGLPVIKTNPHEFYYIVKRKPVTVTCEAYGAMQITFHCSGRDIEAAKQENFQTFDSESGRILVKSSISVTQEDVRRHRGGDYWCECYAWPPEDSETPEDSQTAEQTERFTKSRRGVISVAYIKRRFTEEPSAQTTEVGSKVLMKCTPPESHPPPEIFWRKDKKRLDPTSDSNIVLNDDGSLVIHVARMSDAGDYTCIARNLYGRRESKHGRLTVKEKPKGNVEAKSGTNEGLEQSASDSPTPTGMRFMEEPDSIYYVTQSRPATITCTVKGAEHLNFRCNGRRIPGEKIEKQRSETRDGSERIIKIRYDVVADAVKQYVGDGDKEYSCECFSWYKEDSKWVSAQSMKGVVKIASLGGRFVKDPTDKIVKPGSTVTFTCEAPEGAPTPEITWMRNGAMLEAGAVQNIRIEGSVLTLTHVTRRDMADFSCVASNTVGRRSSSRARLTVSDSAVEETTTEKIVTRKMTTAPPAGTPVYLQDLKENYYITRHENVTLTCKVKKANAITFRCNEGRLEPTQQVIEQEVDAETRERILTASTNVTRAQLQDYVGQGEYSCVCVAWYTSAQTRKWAFLKGVDAKVSIAHLRRRFQKEPQTQVLNTGDTATFNCIAPEGNPKPMLFWSKDGSRIDVDSDSRFQVLLDGGQIEISNLRTSDAGSYSCEAENPAGVRMSRPAALTVEGEDVETMEMESSTAPASTAEPASEPEPESTAEPIAETTTTSVPELTPGVPIFTKEPKQVYYIVKDDPVTITCRTLGAEHLMFNCNGARIPEGLNDTYTAIDPETNLKILERSIQVPRAKVENSDNYECDCTAWYALPDAQDWLKMPKKTKVEIAYIKKRFMQEPVSQSVEMKLTTEIPCGPPKANPEPMVSWLKDDEKINVKDDSNFIVSSSGSLVIQEMRAGDAGMYVCVAENVAGKRMSPAIEITVYEAGAGPEPTPEVKEEVKTVEPVINEATDGPPIFLEEPDSLSYVVKGKTTELICQAEKTGKITFYCNDANVDPSRVRLTEAMDETTQAKSLVATYTVTREDIANSATGSEYTCQCFAWYRMRGDRKDQFVSSRSGVTKIAYIKGPSVQEATMKTGIGGELVALSCTQAKGTPWPTISWEKDGEVIKKVEGSNVVVAGDGSLVILAGTQEDAGTYACFSENVAGKKQSALVELKIKGPERDTTPLPEPYPEVTVSIAENVTEAMHNVTESMQNVTGAMQNVTESMHDVTEVMQNVTESMHDVTEVMQNVTEGTPEPGLDSGHIPIVEPSDVNVTESLQNVTEHVIVKSELGTDNATGMEQTTSTYKNITAAIIVDTTMVDGTTITPGSPEPGLNETTNIPEVVTNTTVDLTTNVELTTGGVSVPESEPVPTTEPEPAVTTITSAEPTPEGAKPKPKPNVNQCIKMFRVCNAILNEKSVDTSSDPSAMCNVRVNYTTCTDNFMDVCKGIIRPELMETITTTREGFEKYCTPKEAKPDKETKMSFPGCRKLQMCYTKFRTNLNKETILLSCDALQNYLTCAEDAITICNIQKPSNTKTTLLDIAGWFSEYCSRIPLIDEDLQQCEQRDACKLPLNDDTSPKDTIDVNHWCPYLHSTLSCTRDIMSECNLQNKDKLESDIHYLDTQAQKYCQNVSESESEGKVVVGQAEENDNSMASNTVISTFAATLLQILAALVIAYR